MVGFSIGGACYPEGMECPSQKEDLRHLKEKKVDCGVDFLVTQMFSTTAPCTVFCTGPSRWASRCRCWRGSCR